MSAVGSGYEAVGTDYNEESGKTTRNLLRLIAVDNLKHILSMPPCVARGLERYVNCTNRLDTSFVVGGSDE